MTNKVSPIEYYLIFLDSIIPFETNTLLLQDLYKVNPCGQLNNYIRKNYIQCQFICNNKKYDDEYLYSWMICYRNIKFYNIMWVYG